MTDLRKGGEIVVHQHPAMYTEQYTLLIKEAVPYYGRLCLRGFLIISSLSYYGGSFEVIMDVSPYYYIVKVIPIQCMSGLHVQAKQDPYETSSKATSIK